MKYRARVAGDMEEFEVSLLLASHLCYFISVRSYNGTEDRSIGSDTRQIPMVPNEPQWLVMGYFGLPRGVRHFTEKYSTRHFLFIYFYFFIKCNGICNGAFYTDVNIALFYFCFIIPLLGHCSLPLNMGYIHTWQIIAYMFLWLKIRSMHLNGTVSSACR